MSPKVSVVMPVYRPVPAYLERAVTSVIDQTLTDWELVIVEDPSDRTGAQVIEAIRDPRIRYHLNSERTGLARQHNHAVAMSQGLYIARFDADDICDPRRLAMQAGFLDRHPETSVVASQLTIIDSDGVEIGLRDYPKEHAAIVEAMHRYNPISGSNAMFRRALHDEIGGWREGVDRPAQDYEWYSRAASRGYRFAILPDRLVCYRRHDEQIKHQKLRGTLITTLEVKRTYWLNTMDLVSKGIFLAESAMLVLPPSLVLWLFQRVRYR
jgi:glycosyltransferase involved in cell wall biosynthesis